MNVQKKFQLKIQTLSKMIGAPSGVQTKFEKKSLAANSGMSIGTKNVIVFCGDFFLTVSDRLKSTVYCLLSKQLKDVQLFDATISSQ